MTPSLKVLTAAVLFAGLPAATHAMPYSQLVIFGDSLSDSGQFPDIGSPLLGGNPTGGLRSDTFRGRAVALIPTIRVDRPDQAGRFAQRGG